MIEYIIQLPDIHSKSRCPTESCGECLKAEIIKSKLLAAIEEVDKLSSAFCDQQKKVNGAHSNIIRSLPVEMVSHIFGYCITVKERRRPREYELHIWEQESSNRLRYKLGSICSTWRQIAWSTPFLWKDLVLCVNLSAPSHPVKLVEEWIERGKTAGLRLHLSTQEKYDDSSASGMGMSYDRYMDKEYTRPFMNLMRPIISSSVHWEEVTLILHSRLLLDVTTLIRDLTNVRSIGIQCEDQDVTENLWINATRASPECISLVGITPDCANIDWKNVTYASVHDVPMDACLEMLRVANNLESCWLGHIFYKEDINSLTMVTHHNIRYFRYSEDRCEWPTILSLLSFPSLVNLHFHPSKDLWCCNEESHFKGFRAFVSRSPSASTFILAARYMPIRPDLVINGLRLVQSFSHLHLENLDDPSGVFEALAEIGMPINGEQPMDEILMPHVQEILITMESRRYLHSPWEKLLALFASPSSKFRSGSKPISFELRILNKVHISDDIPSISVLKELVKITRKVKNIKFSLSPGKRYDMLSVWKKCHKRRA